MSGAATGGGGQGDPFGNIFGGGGGDKQVYPPAPPGYKYVDLNIPQAPPGYSVAKMSGIANNQSTPAPAYGLQGNAGLAGRGAGGRTTYQFPAHTPEGIAERARVALADRAARANQYAELQGLAPPYPMPGQPAPAAPLNPYGGGPGFTPPRSAATPYAVVNPGPGNTTTAGAPAAGPAAAPSMLNPMVPSGAVARPAAPIDPAKGGIVRLSNGGQALMIPGMDHLIPLKVTASGPVPQYTEPKFSPKGAAERVAVQKFIGGLNLEATTDALNPPVVNNAPPTGAKLPLTQTPPANNAPPAGNSGPSSAAQPPDASPNSTSYDNQSLMQKYVPDVLWKLGAGAYHALTGDPVSQSQALTPSANPITAPPVTVPPSYDPKSYTQDGDSEDQ